MNLIFSLSLTSCLVILVDFDLTLCHSSYPFLGEPFEFAQEIMTKWYNQGAYLIINTCRTGKPELEAEAWLLANGIPFHKVNGHHPNGQLEFGNDTTHSLGLSARKIHGHLNIDDTNLDWAVNGFPSWYDIDSLVQKYIDKHGEKYNIKSNYSKQKV